MESYIPILAGLVGEGVEFAVIGTWALKVHFPEAMRDYMIHDCDLVIGPEEGNLRRVLRTLKTSGWAVTAWEEEVSEEFRFSDLAGKFYLRARSGELTLDATFECPIAWEEMALGVTWQNGLPLASVEHILDLKRRKARDSNQVAETEAFIWSLIGH